MFSSFSVDPVLCSEMAVEKLGGGKNPRPHDGPGHWSGPGRNDEHDDNDPHPHNGPGHYNGTGRQCA
jgi:hypothetical protein